MGCSACGLAGAASACPGAANHMTPPPPPPAPTPTPPQLLSLMQGRQGRWGAGALEDDSSCSTPPPALMPTDSEDEAEADSEDEAEAAVEAEAAAPFVVHAFRASGTRKPAE